MLGFGRRRRRQLVLAARRAVVATVLVTGVSVAASLGVDPTSARFGDPARHATGTFTAETLNPPVNVTCTTAGPFGLSSYITWTAPATPPSFDRYLISWTNGILSGTDTVAVGGQTRWRPLISLGLGTYNVQVRTVRGNWTSAAVGTAQIELGNVWGIAIFGC